MPFRSFASDNNAGIHPQILAAIAHANIDHVAGYGDDEYTTRAVAQFKRHFGDDVDVYFVFNGTAANVIGLSAITQPYNAVICSHPSHINLDECGAPERFTGCKLIDIPTPDGKLTVDLIKPHVHGIGVEHHVQVKVISITQSTELGTLYTRAEVRAIADYAHTNGLLLHMDGARISNAAASLGCSLRECSRDCGVDVLSFGGTKNGLMLGEAVVLFPSSEWKKEWGELKFIRKQALQLASKMRYIAVQFEALLREDLWLRNARHANAMAQRLAEAIKGIPGIRLTQPVQANGIFATLPRPQIDQLLQNHFFYIWDEQTHEVRWMTSFDTTEEDIDGFVAALKRVMLA